MGSQRGQGQVTDDQRRRGARAFQKGGKGSGGGPAGGQPGKPGPLEPKPPGPKPPTGPRPPSPPPSPSKCTLSGTVSDQNGVPLAGAKVELRSASIMVVTNEKGYYIFVGLTPGKETLAARLSGFRPYEERIVIGNGQNTRDIVLKSLKEA